MTDEPNTVDDGAAADALADALPEAAEMELRRRLVVAESQLGNHRAAILLLAAGVVILSVLTLLRARRPA